MSSGLVFLDTSSTHDTCVGCCLCQCHRLTKHHLSGGSGAGNRQHQNRLSCACHLLLGDRHFFLLQAKRKSRRNVRRTPRGRCSFKLSESGGSYFEAVRGCAGAELPVLDWLGPKKGKHCRVVVDDCTCRRLTACQGLHQTGQTSLSFLPMRLKLGTVAPRSVTFQRLVDVMCSGMKSSD